MTQRPPLRLRALTLLANAYCYCLCWGVYWCCWCVWHLGATLTPAACRWLKNTALPACGAALAVALLWLFDRIAWLSENGRDTPALCRRFGAWVKAGALQVATVATTTALLLAAVAVLIWKHA